MKCRAYTLGTIASNPMHTCMECIQCVMLVMHAIMHYQNYTMYAINARNNTSSTNPHVMHATGCVALTRMRVDEVEHSCDVTREGCLIHPWIDML